MRKVVVLSLSSVIVTVFFIQLASASNRVSAVQSLSAISVQSRNSISGFVFTESRNPISDAYVELTTDVGSTLQRIKTNSSGLYTFRGLPDGQFNIKVSHYAADYESQTRSVSLVAISAIAGRGAVSEQIDFYLKARRTANNGPLAVPGVIFAQEIPDDAKKLYEKGIEDLANKKENEGFDKLKKALEIFPEYFLALDRLGQEYVVRGHYAAAFVLLTKAIEVNKGSFSSSFGLGISSYRLDQIDKSVESLRRATQIYNKSINAYMWLGIVLHHDKKFSEAETALIEANKLSKGESAEIHWQLARLYKDQNLFQKSADELELYLKYKKEAEDVDKIKEMIKTLRLKKDGN